MEIILANLGVSSVGYQADERLVEAAYGEWEGRTLHEIQQEDPAAYFAREADRWGYAAPGGESAAMALERVRPLLDSLAGPTIIVGHGAVGRAVRQHLLNLDVAEAGAFDFPQDRIFKFENGIEQVICGRQNGR